MKRKIRRLSDRYAKPVDGAYCTIKDNDGVCLEWEFQCNDVFELAKKEGDIIVNKDGSIVIYDD